MLQRRLHRRAVEQNKESSLFAPKRHCKGRWNSPLRHRDESAARQSTQLSKEKPIVTFIADATIPPGKRIEHSGAIVSRGKGTAQGKNKAFEDTEVRVATHPGFIRQLSSKK
jgi:hypothetical protein